MSGRRVDDDVAVPEASEETVLPLHGRLDLRRARDCHHDDVRVTGDRFRCLGGARTLLDGVSHLVVVDVEGRQRTTCLCESVHEQLADLADADDACVGHATSRYWHGDKPAGGLSSPCRRSLPLV